MQMWLLDIDKLVRLNNLKSVTNPISFDRGMYPSKDGLFSNEIFGMTTTERKRTCAYIPLKRKFISPKAYITLKLLNRKFINLINGTTNFSVDENGVLVEDENGGTGIEWLYKNWEKISFPRNDSEKRSQKIDLLEGTKKNEIFIDKLLVVPPFYRDVNLQQVADGANPRVPEVNNLYSAIIRNANMLDGSDTFAIMANAIAAKTQDLIVEVYNMWKEKLEKKYGYIRKFLLGKSVSWCSRVVITADVEDANSPEEHKVDFFHTGIPMSHAIAMSTPFVVYWIKRFFKTNLFDNMNNFPIVDEKTGKKIYVKLENPEVYYNDDYIEKQMDRFINNPSSRFEKIPIPIKKSEIEKYGIKETKYLRFKGYQSKDITTMDKETDEVNRHLTWTDLFFMAVSDMTKDKYVVITRYPVLDYLGSIITRMTILSTRHTTPMIINNVLYEGYPIVDFTIPPEKLDSYFIDSFKLNTFYLKGMVGDHDGDQVTGKMLFSAQANEEAERIMKSNFNILGVNGSPVRNFGNEYIQSLYTLTRFHDIAS